MSAIQLCCGDIVICGDITWCTLIAVCTVQRLNWIMQWLRKSAILPFKILRTVPIWPDALGLWCAVSKQDQRARIPTLSWSYRLDCCRCHRRRKIFRSRIGNRGQFVNGRLLIQVRVRGVDMPHCSPTWGAVTIRRPSWVSLYSNIFLSLSFSHILALSCFILGIFSD